MKLGKRWLFLVGNGVEIRPLEKGRKYPGIGGYMYAHHANNVIQS